MSKKRLEQCKSHDDIVSWSRRNELIVCEAKKHTRIENQDGTAITYVPRHPGDLATGTLRTIIKALSGLALLTSFGVILFYLI
jgi:hypothetical protein